MNYRTTITHLGNDPKTGELNFEWNIWLSDETATKYVSLIAKIRSFEAMQRFTSLLNDPQVVYLNVNFAR